MNRPPKPWLGNIVRPGCRVVSDGHTIFLLSAVRPNQRERLLKRNNARKVVSGRAALETWTKSCRLSQLSVVIHDRPVLIVGLAQECISVTPKRGRGRLYVDNAKLRLLGRCVRWTRATIKTFAWGCPVVFWDEARPVALLMPLITPVDEW